MEATTITVSLPTNVLRDVERIAQERNISIDKLVTEMLAQLVRTDAEYEAAKADYFAILAQDIHAGNYGKGLGPRDDLHER
jgi:hypothetical protein